jgi:hypothetical protein
MEDVALKAAMPTAQYDLQRNAQTVLIPWEVREVSSSVTSN